jgi:hypothetical protein
VVAPPLADGDDHSHGQDGYDSASVGSIGR